LAGLASKAKVTQGSLRNNDALQKSGAKGLDDKLGLLQKNGEAIKPPHFVQN